MLTKKKKYTYNVIVLIKDIKPVICILIALLIVYILRESLNHAYC